MTFVKLVCAGFLGVAMIAMTKNEAEGQIFGPRQKITQIRNGNSNVTLIEKRRGLFGLRREKTIIVDNGNGAANLRNVRGNQGANVQTITRRGGLLGLRREEITIINNNQNNFANIRSHHVAAIRHNAVPAFVVANHHSGHVQFLRAEHHATFQPQFVIAPQTAYVPCANVQPSYIVVPQRATIRVPQRIERIEEETTETTDVPCPCPLTGNAQYLVVPRQQGLTGQCGSY